MVYIKKLEITAFGKFKNFQMEFENGFNEFIFENEFGKSTLTDFIIFMLYGFTKSNSKKLALEDNLLKKYLPWDDDEKISGAMELEYNQKIYRIERLQRKAGTGPCSVYDLTGAQISIQESPGEYFFKVDKDTFLRTFIVRQADMLFAKTDGIETALKNLVTTGDEDSSFEDALENLKEQKKKYQYGTSRAGKIFTLPKEIAYLKEQNQSDSTSIERMAQSLAELEGTRHALQDISDRQKELEKEFEKAKANDYARRLSKLESAEKILEECSLRLSDDYENITENQLDKESRILEEFESSQKELASKKEQADRTKAIYEQKLKEFPDYDVFRQNEQEIISLLNQKNKSNSLLLIFGIILMAVCIPLFIFTKPIIAIIPLLLGAIMTVFSFILKPSVKIPEQYAKNQSELSEKYKVFKNMQFETDSAKLNCTFYIQEFDDAKEKFDECEKLCKECKFESITEINKARAILQNKDIIIKQIEAQQKQIEEILQGDTKEKLISLAQNGDTNGIFAQDVMKAMTELTELKRQYIAKESSQSESAKQKSELEKAIFEREQEIAKLESELSEGIYQNDVLELAISSLTEAYDKINSIFSPILSEKAKDALVCFTDGKYDSILLDKNFDIKLRHDGVTRELGYFSKGTKEAVYFALRQGASEIISGESFLPFILDDPFWALDENRQATAKEYLKKLSQQKQIIIFSAK